jgi:hypothetical protein
VWLLLAGVGGSISHGICIVISFGDCTVFFKTVVSTVILHY